MSSVSRRGFLVGTILAAAVPRAAVAGGPTISAGAFGATGDGATDATAALNAAARAVPESGGVLLVPPGRYRITGTIVLKSGTTMTGSGATIFGSDEWRPSLAGRSLVTNAGCTEANITDHDITLHNIAFEYVGTQFGNAHAVQLRKVRGILVQNCSFSGGGNGTAFLACLDTEVANCVSQGTLNCAFDHWEGSSDCVVRDCMVTCAQSYGILFTGVGTSGNDHRSAVRLSAINNRIHSPTEAGIWVCALSQFSSLAQVTLRDNYVYGGFAKSAGIGASGDVRTIAIENNTIEDIHGGSAIFVRPDKWNRPRGVRIVGNRMIRCETDAGNVALIQALCDDVEVAGNRASGGRFASMVWADGRNVALRDNAGGELTGHFKYNVARAVHPAIADP